MRTPSHELVTRSERVRTAEIVDYEREQLALIQLIAREGAIAPEDRRTIDTARTRAQPVLLKYLTRKKAS